MILEATVPFHWFQCFSDADQHGSRGFMMILWKIWKIQCAFCADVGVRPHIYRTHTHMSFAQKCVQVNIHMQMSCHGPSSQAREIRTDAGLAKYIGTLQELLWAVWGADEDWPCSIFFQRIRTAIEAGGACGRARVAAVHQTVVPQMYPFASFRRVQSQKLKPCKLRPIITKTPF